MQEGEDLERVKPESSRDTDLEAERPNKRG